MSWKKKVMMKKRNDRGSRITNKLRFLKGSMPSHDEILSNRRELLISISAKPLFKCPRSFHSMKDVLDNYKRNFQGKEQRHETEMDSTEIMAAQQQLTQLQHRQRQLLGEDLEGLSLQELQTLESKLEKTLKLVRSHKAQIVKRNINELRNEEKIMIEDNKNLRKKLRETEGMLLSVMNKEIEEIIHLKQREDTQLSTQPISTVLEFSFSKQALSEQEAFDTSLHLGLKTPP